ncbi:type II secretion system F family protein [Brevibacillus ginsengisoli]|uniref:type II secretion system F family protein n=1 Tax=Brevibacillus ginsengisoli TaxID=363854 RepID=UPI003CF8FE44
MIVSLLLFFGILLVFLPSSFLVIHQNKNDLFSRIHIEQQKQLQASFRLHDHSKFQFLSLLKDPERMKKIARYVGFDQQKISLCLTRLGWNMTVQDLLLAKLLGCVCLLLSVGYSIVSVYGGSHLGYGHFLLIAFCVLLFLFPTQMIEIADRQAKKEIKNQTPIFFGIVLSLLDAGMPIHSAIRATAKRFAGRLGQELMALETTERSYGNWRIALEEFAFRWDVDELLTIVSDINQSLTKGTTVAHRLSLHIEEQIKQQEDEATEYINRISVRFIPFVIVFMGVPLLFLVMGPSFKGILGQL